ncbi:adenylate/guanylate cyclase domain-containing protein [Paractinoplanes ferrugineus]|uniref:adenylate/guanylate cyclase domain-containing protein n=3 Tax=Paractinoplanes ferrugineus TaxID=113564 RepID=UPI0031D48BE9
MTVMTVDLVDSTTAISASPGTRMMEMMRDSAAPIRPLTERLGGTVIKFTGDGYLVTFPSATSALHAATEIIQLFDSRGNGPAGDLKECRIALNTCDVISYETDVLGEGVVVAARMEKYVPVNSVYVTAAVRNVAKSSEFDFIRVDDLVLKGLPEPVAVYRLITESYRGVERGVLLTVTDLVGLTQEAATMPLTVLNRALQDWVDLHRAALRESAGRLRAIAGDNVISTHTSADAAVDFLMSLQRLVTAYNTDPEKVGRRVAYTAVINRGDLFVPDYGVAGPLVSGAFRMLGSIPAGAKVISQAVFRSLTRNQDLFDAEGTSLAATPGEQRFHSLRIKQ